MHELATIFYWRRFPVFIIRIIGRSNIASMSAYAMFPMEALPQLKKKISNPKPTIITISSNCSTSTMKPSGSRSADHLKQQKLETHLGRPPLPGKISDETSSMNLCDEAENDLGISVTSANLDRKRFIAATSTSSRVKKAGSIDQWEAVEYELSIDYDGKKYTARRSFPRMRRLRDELVREVQTRRSNYPGKFGVLRSFMTHLAPEIDHLTDDSSSDSDDDSVIPELPADLCSDDGVDNYNPVGLAGRTLNMIQSSATGNCPHLEAWLKSVSKVVSPSTSPSLRSFLAESLEPEECLPRLFPRARRFLRRQKNRGSFGNLSSISEDDVIDSGNRKDLAIESKNEELSIDLYVEDEDDDSYSEFDLS